MFPITDEQRYVTLDPDDAFAEWYVTAFMPKYCADMVMLVSPAGLREMTVNGRRRAESFGIDDVPSQYHFVTLMWKVGPNFFTFPGFREVVLDAGLTGPEKIDALYAVPRERAVAAILGADDRWWHPGMLEPTGGGVP